MMYIHPINYAASHKKGYEYNIHKYMTNIANSGFKFRPKENYDLEILNQKFRSQL